MWHRDFPEDSNRNMWDIVAKALMLRAGGNVELTATELRAAAMVQAEVELADGGGINFRAERQ